MRSTLSCPGKSRCPWRSEAGEAGARADAGGGAKAFLAEALERLGEQPLQVDGGAEFRGGFEDECAQRKLPLKVLPPRWPELNGIVECANHTARIECRSQYDGELTRQAMNAALNQCLDHYNGPAALLTLHANARRTGSDDGQGYLTDNVRKVGDPAHLGRKNGCFSPNLLN